MRAARTPRVLQHTPLPRRGLFAPNPRPPIILASTLFLLGSTRPVDQGPWSNRYPLYRLQVFLKEFLLAEPWTPCRCFPSRNPHLRTPSSG